MRKRAAQRITRQVFKPQTKRPKYIGGTLVAAIRPFKNCMRLEKKGNKMELKEMALAIMENCKKYSQPYAYTHDCIVPECMLHARCAFNHRQGPSGWAKCRLIPNVTGRYMDHPDMPKNWKIEPPNALEAGEQQATAKTQNVTVGTSGV